MRITIHAATLMTSVGLCFTAVRTPAVAVPFAEISDCPVKYILGASSGDTGLVAVVESRPLTRKYGIQYEFVTFTQDGVANERIIITDNSHRQGGHKAFVHNGQLRFGWIDIVKGIQIASLQHGIVNTETLLAADYKEGAEVGFWILEAKGLIKLFVERPRSVDPDGRDVMGSRQYVWLYSYTLGKNGPVFEGKSCVEDLMLRSSKMECTLSDNDVVVWQTVRQKLNDRQTLRYAKWNDGGKLEWINRYTGNSPLGYLVDATDGSACLVNEWKSPIDASGILCWVRTDVTKTIHVGNYGRDSLSELVRLSRLPAMKQWVIARKEPKGLRIDILNNGQARGTEIQVDGEHITDYVLVTHQEDIYVVLLQEGLLSYKKINLNPRPETMRKPADPGK